MNKQIEAAMKLPANVQILMYRAMRDAAAEVPEEMQGWFTEVKVVSDFFEKNHVNSVRAAAELADTNPAYAAHLIKLAYEFENPILGGHLSKMFQNMMVA